MSDILEDIKERLAAIGFLDAKVELVIMDVRKDWNGERPYISVKIDVDKKMSERNCRMMLEFKNGESVPLLARRYQITRQRVWKIIKELSTALPCAVDKN